MKKNHGLFILLVVPFGFLLAGCIGVSDPNTVEYMTADEIVAYMNENFDGEFSEISYENVNENSVFGVRAKMECLLDGKTFTVTAEDFSYNGVFGYSGWKHNEIETNYYTYRYEDEIKQYVKNVFDVINNSYFAETDYKLIVACNDYTYPTPKTKYKSVEEFLLDDHRNWVIDADLIIRGDFLNDTEFKKRYDSFAFDCKQYEAKSELWSKQFYNAASDKTYDLIDTIFTGLVVNTTDDISALDFYTLREKYDQFYYDNVDSESDTDYIDTTGKYILKGL